MLLSHISGKKFLERYFKAEHDTIGCNSFISENPKYSSINRDLHRHTILAHLSFRDFSSPSLFSYSPRLSLSLSHSPLSHSLSLFNSLPLSLTHSLPHLSLSLTPPSLSASFPPFLSFHLRLFNLIHLHPSHPPFTP